MTVMTFMTVDGFFRSVAVTDGGGDHGRVDEGGSGLRTTTAAHFDYCV